jgi:hypothetical protein
VIDGLRRAAADVRRGAIGREKLRDMKEAVESFITGLDAYDDKQAATRSDELQPTRCGDHKLYSRDPTRLSAHACDGQSSVLCVAGAGPFDEAASAILIQLLGKHGIGARRVRYADVSRQRIGALDVTGAMMACICYLDPDTSSASLRYLSQRLPQRLPKEVPILVGFLRSGGAALNEDNAASPIDAEYFAASFAEAVAVCAEAARNAAQRVS